MSSDWAFALVCAASSISRNGEDQPTVLETVLAAITATQSSKTTPIGKLL
jgi:hypothetical protein